MRAQSDRWHRVNIWMGDGARLSGNMAVELAAIAVRDWGASRSAQMLALALRWLALIPEDVEV
ncbi:MAG: hypothetical protein ACFB9N_11925 [Geitlerinemataceae cyanobacterium]